MPAPRFVPAPRRDGFAVALALGVALGAAAVAHAQPSLLIEGHESVATADGALGTLFNPALVGLRYPSELRFASTLDDLGHDQRYDALAAWRSLGLRFTRWPGTAEVGGITLAGGSPAFRVGWSGEWVGPDLGAPKAGDHRLGLLSRPARWLSVGATADHLFQPGYAGRVRERQYTLGVALRPLPILQHDLPAARGATHLSRFDATRLTVWADALAPEHEFRASSRLEPTWRIGYDLELFQGIATRYSYETGTRVGSFGLVFRLPRVAFAGKLTGVEKIYKDTGHGSGGAAALSPWLPSGKSLTAAGKALPNNWQTYSLSFHSGEDVTLLVPPGARRVGVMGIGGELGDDDVAGWSLLGGAEGASPVAPLHQQLDFALHDRLTRGVLLELGGVSNGAAIEELRPRILALRAAGKPVVAYLEEGGGRGDLLLASACDRVFASEEAMFWSLGLRIERRYYRKFLEDLGLRIDRASIGKYKSAYRNFSADSTPPADREVLEHVLDQSQESFVSTVAEARHMPRARLETLLDGRQWPSSELAKAGLIDSVGYRDQALRALGQLARRGRRPASVELADVERAGAEWAPPRGVAVVYASGGIEVGESGNDVWNGPTLGAATLIRQTEAAFRRPDVRAVVFRIESPGGSVLASDLIFHALTRMKEETGKPLIVSMGSVAASGGYFIALPGDRLFADRQTRTGSIGVVFTKPSLEGFYAKHGVKQEDFERGAAMRAGSFARDWDAAMQASADSAIARTYDRFVDRVAAARKLPRERVLEVAQGRVWLGEDARERGLIDEIGGLDAAIAYAKKVANLPAGLAIDPLEYRRPRPGLLQRLAGSWLRESLAREARLPATGVRFEAGDDLGF